MENRTGSIRCPQKETGELRHSRILPMTYEKWDKRTREKIPDNIHCHRAEKASGKYIPHFCWRRPQEMWWELSTHHPCASTLHAHVWGQATRARRYLRVWEYEWIKPVQELMRKGKSKLLRESIKKSYSNKSTRKTPSHFHKFSHWVTLVSYISSQLYSNGQRGWIGAKESHGTGTCCLFLG